MERGVLRGLLEDAIAGISADDGLQLLVRERIVAPLLQATRSELAPYLYAAGGAIVLMATLMLLVTGILLAQILRR